jgi:hypothetical protein
LTHLEEIDAMRQEQELQRPSIVAPIIYLKFIHDKERKVLYFTGKFDKVEEKAIDFDRDQVFIDKYKYSFQCYDTNDPLPSLLIWPCDVTEAHKVLYYLSNNETILEVICNGGPRSKSKTYQINPPIA